MYSNQIEVLVATAQEVGIPVPEREEYDTFMFAHWTILSIIQPPVLTWEETIKNARILAEIPKNRLIHMKWEDFEEKGMII